LSNKETLSSYYRNKFFCFIVICNNKDSYMNELKRIALVVYFLISVVGLYSQTQYTISGYVTDADVGETLLGANIYDIYNIKEFKI